MFDWNGILISHLSYTYGTNGIAIPGDEPWRTNLIDADRIVADARAARELGAEVVIVSMHWGTEGRTAPDSTQRAVADAVTASGAVDLIIGHHAHVLQPIEQVNGVWVAFGLGNILSNLPTSDKWPAASQDAAIVEFVLHVDDAGIVTVDRPVVHPTWVDKDHGWVIRDVRAALRNNDIAGGAPGRRELEESLVRTATLLGEFFS